MGGQEGDKGVIKTSEGEFAVETTIKLKGGKIGHVGTMTKGMMKVGDTATMEVSPAYRADTVSYTHLCLLILEIRSMISCLKML